MFVDEVLDAVEFKSSWKKQRSLADGECQTKELEVHEAAAQSIKRKHKQVQTEEDIEEQIEISEDDSPEFAAFIKRMVPAMLDALKSNTNSRAFDGKQSQTEEIMEAVEAADVNDDELLQFLPLVEPLVHDALVANTRTRAFDGYDVMFGDENDTITNTHTLTNAQLENQLQVTGLSWSCTGASIAASFGRFDHEDWCTHRSCLSTWNLDRRGLDEKKADMSIDVPSCLMCIACHPKKPAWIVGGTFNGEIIVWDLSKEDDPIIATSGIGDDSHREPVAKVQWVLDPDSKGGKYNIMSVSSDGRMLVWQMSSKKAIVRLVDGFILLTESLPRQLKRSGRGDQEMGVTCMSFNPDDETTFMVGSESGGVFKCSTTARGTPARRDLACSVDLRSPVTFSYSPHHGPVYSVECSPYHRNLFLSCGTDNTIRMYSILQSLPVHSLEPGSGYLFSIKWSPVRPLVFAAATEAGELLIYDMRHSQAAPRHRILANDRKTPLYTLTFNHRQHNLLATGDGMGNIQVWKLSDELVQQTNNEKDVLDAMTATNQD